MGKCAFSRRLRFLVAKTMHWGLHYACMPPQDMLAEAGAALLKGSQRLAGQWTNILT